MQEKDHASATAFVAPARPGGVVSTQASPEIKLASPSQNHAEAFSHRVAPYIPTAKKSALGQFMTPPGIARFMASLFPPASLQTCRLLDPGAGTGVLCSAFLDRWVSGTGLDFQSVQVEAYEIDETLRGYLKEALAEFGTRFPVDSTVLSGDFIWEAACKSLRGGARFTHAILNPPYKKIGSGSEHRLILRRVGIETVNLYSAFLALAITLMDPGGQLVAIIPRSFCNGPYYRPFREFLLARVAIRYIHLFGSRTHAFKDDHVLQENVIVQFEHSATQGKVVISNSTDTSFADLTIHEHPFERIVFPNDPERFIHIPTSPERNPIELSSGIRFSLDEIGIGVSTGPIVDFRLREHVRQMAEPGTVPLLYPCHFTAGGTRWPVLEAKRGNAISVNARTKKWLYPNGFYVVARRFSSKEERRRITASVVTPSAFHDASMLGFENHLNVFHESKRGLPEDLAHGLAAFLNTTAIDDYFRRFNGHTQVNATDLRILRYPSREKLAALGLWARTHSTLNQQILDDQLEKLDE